tara:strand:+ start:871 stop:1500 length:630 start_codon:yes stop_codon:yes gene_type:complete
MDYATLTSTVDNICENTFTAADHIMFTQQTEQKIHNTVQLPALRKTCTGNLTASNRYLVLPTDYLFSYAIAAIDGSGVYNYLLFKDSNFLREAYPNPASTGLPKHYSMFDELSLEVGPTPDSNYSVEINYGSYPVSIVTAGNTWLGDNFDSALLNGALVEAIRFMKGEDDLVAVYDKLYMQAIALLKGLSDGKLRTDAYRTGQVSDPVT